MKRWVLRISVFLLAFAAGLLYVRFSNSQISYRPQSQPVDYNHYLHVHVKEIACEDCHQSVKTGYFATIPSIETCAMCHSEPQGSSEKEKKFLQQFVKTEQPLPWKRLFVLPDHVFFSHRVHVAGAEIKCQECHGAMDMQKQPPPRPLKVQTMEDCLDCHRQRKAVLDCNGCHK